MTGVAIVGTGFGCITHLRALARRRLRRAGTRRPRSGQDRRTRRALRGSERAHHPRRRARAPGRRRGRRSRRRPTPTRRSRSESIAAGKHVLCEKPFARDADEASRMLDAAEAAGVVHLLGTEFRWAIGPGVSGTRRATRRDRHAQARVVPPAHPDARRPRGRGPDLVGHRGRGRRLARRAGCARDRPDPRHARPDHRRKRVAQPSCGPRLGRRGQLHRALPHRLRRRGHDAEHGRRVGTADLRHPRRRRCGDRLAGVRHRARRRRERDARSADARRPAARRGRSAARRSAHHRLRQPAPVRHRDRSVDAYCARPSARSSKVARFPTIPRPATFADGLAAMRVIDAIRRSDRERIWVDIP